MLSVWEQLLTYQRRTLRSMDDHLSATFRRGLDHYDVLCQLAEADRPLKMGELAQQLLVANSSCHRIVSRLTTDGLVSTVVDEHDRRSRLVSLTRDGIDLHQQMATVHHDDIRRHFTDLVTTQEMSRLARLIDVLDERSRDLHTRT